MRLLARPAGFDRAAKLMGSLAICILTAATNLAPPPVDTAMVERAVSGAEWLAAQAEAEPERVEAAAAATDLTDWLLVAGGADGPNYEPFASYLTGIGYDDPLFAVQTWLEEIPRVLTAVEAAESSTKLRSLGEIQAEIRTLPIVPLDEAGEAERDQLFDEMALVLTMEDERQAAAQAKDRIAVLQAIFAKATNR